MNRRGFLRRLGAVAAAPLAVNATLLEPGQKTSKSFVVPDTPMAIFNGRAFKLIRAHRDLAAGELVCVEDNVPLGVATRAITKGCHAWIQVGGPVAVKASWR